MPPVLVPEDLAVYYTRRPPTTIRRWAVEGRIRRYGRGRGQVRYDLAELPRAVRDAVTGEWRTPEPPPLPTGRRAA